ncbi:MAG TPA: flagellar basal body-associated FliL family protein [Desulfobacteria bacterium]|nr:flagellar basal body-associated FliL family protein [Desulfobacteria bacterium]
MKKKQTVIVALTVVLGIGVGVALTLGAQKVVGVKAFNNMIESFQSKDQTGPMVSLGDFTVNLQGDSFLKTSITVEGVDAKSEEVLKTRIAIIQDKVNSVLADRSLAEVSTPAAREKLRQELLQQLNAVADNQIRNILFVSFVYQ